MREAQISRRERFPDALDRLLQLTVVLNEDMTRRLARDGLTVSRAGVLWQLRESGPTTQRMLADAVGVSARTMTGLVDGLVATGFVRRAPHPTDRRATLVTPTARATRVLGALERERVTFTGQLFADMAVETFDAMVDGLDHVLARIRRELSRPGASRSQPGAGRSQP
jgi:DNA-binding MarR family transcriptional regulator